MSAKQDVSNHELTELKAINEVYQILALTTYSQFSLPQFLQLILQTAVRLTRAQYGALGVFDATGTHLIQFLTVGIDEATRQEIGRLPSGQGLLGHLVHEESVLRLKDLTKHSRALGFPPHHPPMKTFLGVSIRAHGRIFGRLYLTEKQEADEFTEIDMEVVKSLAIQSGTAIENGTLFQEIRAAEDKYRLLLQSTTDGIFGIDRQSRITFANQAALKQLGYTADELMNQPAHELLCHAKPNSSVYSASECPILESARDGRGHPNATEIFYCKDGISIPVEFTSTPMMEQNEVVGSVVVFRDISDRQRAMTALRESQQRFQQLAENIEEVFWLTDPEKNDMIYVSPAYQQIWGRSCESLYTSPRSWLEAIHPIDRNRVEGALSRQASGAYDEEYQVVRPDGSTRWIWDRAFPIRDDQGKVYRIAGLAADISNRKELERQLLQSQKMEAIGQLTGGIAHDFNNMLTVINNYSEMLLDEINPNNISQRAEAESIKEAGEKAAVLTRQLLAFSRRQVFEVKVLDLNEIVSNVLTFLRRLIGEDISLKVCLAPTLGCIKADLAQIEQAIINLVVNARDAMPGGGLLTIETQDVELDSIYAQQHIAVTPGRYVMLAVSDTGCGMDAKTKARIFEPFFTTKTVGKGTGLGLSTVYGVVKQSRGNIWVYSEQGKGSIFKIYLPEVKEQVEPTCADPVSPENLRGSETILVVEDEKLVLTVARAILERYGYTVLVAHDTDEALRLAQDGSRLIHLLLTDTIMPKMNGPELAVRIISMRPKIKVLFLSGYMDNALLAVIELKPGIAFLQKPFTQVDLSRKVREVLDKPQPR